MVGHQSDQRSPQLCVAQPPAREHDHGGSGGTPGGYRVTTMVYLHNIVVKQQPVAMALDYGDVVSSVGATEEEREQNLLTAGDQCVSYSVSLTCHSALPLQ